jgi:hypothetical protein
MKQTVYLNDFIDAFQKIRPDNFSYEGLEILYDYLEEFYSDASTELELDVIALCCNFTEQTLEDFNRDYADDEKMSLEDAIEYLRDNTDFLGMTPSKNLLYQQF